MRATGNLYAPPRDSPPAAIYPPTPKASLRPGFAGGGPRLPVRRLAKKESSDQISRAKSPAKEEVRQGATIKKRRGRTKVDGVPEWTPDAGVRLARLYEVLLRRKRPHHEYRKEDHLY